VTRRDNCDHFQLFAEDRPFEVDSVFQHDPSTAPPHPLPRKGHVGAGCVSGHVDRPDGGHQNLPSGAQPSGLVTAVRWYRRSGGAPLIRRSVSTQTPPADRRAAGRSPIPGSRRASPTLRRFGRPDGPLRPLPWATVRSACAACWSAGCAAEATPEPLFGAGVGWASAPSLRVQNRKSVSTLRCSVKPRRNLRSPARRIAAGDCPGKWPRCALEPTIMPHALGLADEPSVTVE
jgi:hypothetical protein